MAYLIPTVLSIVFALCILSNEGVYGSENVQKNCNAVCPLNYRPVCGTDGKTYSNQCLMDAKINCDGLAINKAYDGECTLEQEDYRPHCVPDDDALECGCPCAIRCSNEYIPVCGSDGKTYRNVCQLATTHSCDETPVRKCYDGECKSELVNGGKM